MIILRQKEFGLIGKVADYFGRRAYESNKRNNAIINNQNSIPINNQKQINNELFRAARKKKIVHADIRPGNEFAIIPKDLDENYLNTSRNNLRLARQRGRKNLTSQEKPIILKSKGALNGGFVSVGIKTNPYIVAHELGHIYDSDSKQYDKLMNKFNKASENLYNLRNSEQSRYNAIKESINEAKRGLAEVRIEKRANKAGYSLLKDSKSGSNNLSEFSNSRKAPIKTYTSGNLMRVLEPIARYKDKSIIEDTARKINPRLSQNVSKAINTVYRRGGRF